MKSSRRPRRPVLDCLEPRIALSGASAQIASASSSSGFPLGETATLKKGEPVLDLITSTYPDGSTATATRSIVPDLANKTTTTTIVTNLAGGGVEKTVDVATSQGAITTQTYRATDPSGATTFEAVTDIQQGPATKFHAIIDQPSGATLILSGTLVKRNSTTISNENIIGSDGKITHSHIVDTLVAPNLHSTTTQITPNIGAITTTITTSTYTRLQVPTS